jgi:hypothetical protein
MKKTRTVLRIRDGEFLMVLHEDRVETCNHVKDAMDITDLDINTMMNLMKNLYLAGHNEARVMEVK